MLARRGATCNDSKRQQTTVFRARRVARCRTIVVRPRRLSSQAGASDERSWFAGSTAPKRLTWTPRDVCSRPPKFTPP